MLLELLGWIGALLLLSALAIGSLNPLAAPRAVACMNFIGGVLLCTQAVLLVNWPVASLNSVWATVSLLAVWRLRRPCHRCITVGGQSASGKTTLVRAIRDRLRTEGEVASTLETGRMYRSLGRYLASSGVNVRDEVACVRRLEERGLTIVDGLLMIGGNSMVTDGTEEEGALAAAVARHHRVRTMLGRAIHRCIAKSLRQNAWIIVDARDGPVLCPNARHYWLHCPIEVRAARRAAQTGVLVDEVMRCLRERDASDQGLGRIDALHVSDRKDVTVLDGTRTMEDLVSVVLSEGRRDGV